MKTFSESSMYAGLNRIAAIFNPDFFRLKMRCSIFGTGK
jgi:hypothetical protein